MDLRKRQTWIVAFPSILYFVLLVLLGVDSGSAGYLLGSVFAVIIRITIYFVLISLVAQLIVRIGIIKKWGEKQRAYALMVAVAASLFFDILLGGTATFEFIGNYAVVTITLFLYHKYFGLKIPITRKVSI